MSSVTTIRHPPIYTLFPYTTLFRSWLLDGRKLPRYVPGAASAGDRRLSRQCRRPHDAVDQRPELAVSSPVPDEDRKSTRLNSSHQIISYAVFCLKKKRL